MFLGIFGILWGFWGFFRVLKGFGWFVQDSSGILRGFVEDGWDSLGFSKSLGVFLGIFGILWGFWGFFRVLKGFGWFVQDSSGILRGFVEDGWDSLGSSKSLRCF